VHGLVTEQFAGQYGRIRDQQTAIVAMGRLGSREMTASSDLDLILLYDYVPDIVERRAWPLGSRGPRSCHGNLAMALPVGWTLISALSNILIPKISKSFEGPAPTTSVNVAIPMPINSPFFLFQCFIF
jgi:hypothetical protein